MNRQQLAEKSEAYLRELLRKHLPENTQVYLFGSRARGDARWNSDYDLWIDAEIAPSVMTEITEALEDSFVPFRVDLVTTAQLKDRFGQEVRKEAARWM